MSIPKHFLLSGEPNGHGLTSENIQNYDKYFSQSSCLCLFDWVEGWNPQRHLRQFGLENIRILRKPSRFVDDKPIF